MKLKTMGVIAAALVFSAHLNADTWEQVSNSNMYVNLAVKSMVVDSATNTLYVGGVPGVVKYNGTTWTSMSAGLSMASVDAMTVFNGTLYVGGMGLGTGSNCLYKWNGTGWDAIPVGLCGPVKSMVVYNGQLLVAGITYPIMGNVNTVGFGAWNGSVWSVFGGGYAGWNPGGAVTMKNFSTGLYAGGAGSTLPSGATALKKYDGANSWEDASEGAGINLTNIWSMAEYGGGIIVGGDFSGGKKLALVSGGGWSTFGGGADSTVFAVQPFNSKLYIGGSFTHAGTVACNYVARWDGAQWEPIGTGMGNSQPYVLCMAVYNNKLIAGGQFTRADGKVIANIAQLVEGTTGIASKQNLVDELSVTRTSSASSIIFSLPSSSAGPWKVSFYNARGRTLYRSIVEVGKHVVVDRKSLGKGIVFYMVALNGTTQKSGSVINF